MNSTLVYASDLPMMHRRDQIFAIYLLDAQEESAGERDAPMAVRTARARSTSPARPPGRTNDVPMSVERPVIHLPIVATASEPSVSVRERISPPCTICGRGKVVSGGCVVAGRNGYPDAVD